MKAVICDVCEVIPHHLMDLSPSQGIHCVSFPKCRGRRANMNKVHMHNVSVYFSRDRMQVQSMYL